MLVLCLLMASLFLTLSLGYLGVLVAEARHTERVHRLNLALHLAESGAEEAIWEIKYNSGNFASANGWSGSDPVTKTASIDAPNGENLGSYSVSVAGPSSSSPMITSVGNAIFGTSTMSEDRTVEVTLSTSGSAPYTMAVFANDEIVLSSNSCTDSFDSTLGPYSTHPSSTNNGSNGDVGTNSILNGYISLDSNSEIDGDAFVGVGGNPSSVITTSSNTDITGSETAMSAIVSIPSVTAPTGLPSQGDITYDGNGSYTLSSSGQYSNLSFDGNVTVTVTGNVQLYVTNQFSMDSNSELYIAPGASLELYVDNSFQMSSNTNINNNTLDPSRFVVYGTDAMTGNEAISIDSNTEIYGVIHAKNAGVTLSSNAEVFGAILADTVTLDSNTCVHYDESLGSGSGGAGSSATVTLWQEK